MNEYFVISNVWISSILSALAIIIFYLLEWALKKLFKNNTKKGLAVLNICLNVLLAICFIVSILLISGLQVGKLIESVKTVSLSQFLEQNIVRIISIILVIVISSIIQTTVITVLKATKPKKAKDQKRKRTLDKVIISITRYLLWIVDAVVILMLLGVNVIPALAGLGIAGLVLGLGAQKLITDFISGLFIIIEHHFDVGDIIEIGGFKGEVIDIGLKTTKIRNWQGHVKILANSEMASLINHSVNDTVFATTFTISYQEDIDKVIKLINEELPKKLQSYSNILKMPVCNGVTAIGQFGVTLNVVTTAKTETQYQLTRDMNIYIQEILKENNIDFPMVDK